MPAEEVEPSYAQLYIYDPQEANDRRVCRNSLLNPEILLDLSITLSASHSYAEIYKQAYEIMRVSSIVFLKNMNSYYMYNIGQASRGAYRCLHVNLFTAGC